jgi:hypothetical protein
MVHNHAKHFLGLTRKLAATRTNYIPVGAASSRDIKPVRPEAQNLRLYLIPPSPFSFSQIVELILNCAPVLNVVYGMMLLYERVINPVGAASSRDIKPVCPETQNLRSYSMSLFSFSQIMEPR